MNWKYKALIQNAISLLPEPLSNAAYYPLQRRVGGLRVINPMKRLRAGITIWERIVASGGDPVGKTFFEVGTGRMVNVPIAYWLMGAHRTKTFDLNRYLKAELVLESLRYIAAHRGEVEALFGQYLVPERLDQLIEIVADPRCGVKEQLAKMGIDYKAPADAAETGLPAGSIDFHTSYTVLEHVSPSALHAILSEAGRLLGESGLAIHGIDYSDHFSHSDAEITAVNFLRYSQAEWKRLAGNRYMYMNRMRHGDYLRLFAESGLQAIAEEAEVDARSLQEIERGLMPVDDEFALQAPEQLAAVSGWIVAQPRCVASIA